MSELQCVVGARTLALREGILAGASTGGVVAALALLAPGFPPDSRVAFIVHDGGLPYLETVYSDDWVQRELSAPSEEITETASLLFGALS